MRHLVTPQVRPGVHCQLAGVIKFIHTVLFFFLFFADVVLCAVLFILVCICSCVCSTIIYVHIIEYNTHITITNTVLYFMYLLFSYIPVYNAIYAHIREK